MNKILGIIAVGAVLLGGVYFVVRQPTDVLPPVVVSEPVATTTTSTPPVVTTTTSSGTGVVSGQVLVSPTCPNVQNPPRPGCDPRGYATTIQVSPVNSEAASVQVSTDKLGYYTISLRPGTYTFKAGNMDRLPSCPQQEVKVAAGGKQTVNIDCDSGIR